MYNNQPTNKPTPSNFEIEEEIKDLGFLLNCIYEGMSKLSHDDPVWIAHARERDITQDKIKELKIIIKNNIFTEENSEEHDIGNEIPDERFRFHCQRVLLTYREHIDKDFLYESLNRVQNTKKCYIAHENGDKTNPYLHTHVVIEFTKKIDKTSPRCFDVNWNNSYIHPHIRAIPLGKNGKNLQPWKRACKYITKEDTTVVLDTEDVFDDEKQAVTAMWRMNTLGDALETITDLRLVNSVVTLMDNKPFEWRGKTKRVAITSLENMYPWQNDMYTFLQTFPPERDVYWIADIQGKQGKNTFIDYMCDNFPDKCIEISISGQLNNIQNMLIGAIKNGWCGDTIFINCERSGGVDKANIYRLIEQWKDGKVSSSMYKGFHMSQKPAFHVMVFANEYPKVHEITNDRWKIFKIENKESRYVDFHDVQRLGEQKQGEFNPMGN